VRSLLLTGSGVGSEKREGLWAVDYGPSTVDYSPLLTSVHRGGRIKDRLLGATSNFAGVIPLGSPSR